MKKGALFTDNTGQQIIQEVTTDSYIDIFWYSIKDFFSWWYLEMPVRHLRRLQRLIVILNDQLSITLLISNFFLPWRRHKSFPGYFFGIVIKAIYIPVAIAGFLICTTLYFAFIIFWLLIPVALIFAITKTITT